MFVGPSRTTRRAPPTCRNRDDPPVWPVWAGKETGCRDNVLAVSFFPAKQGKLFRREPSKNAVQRSRHHRSRSIGANPLVEPIE